MSFLGFGQPTATPAPELPTTLFITRDVGLYRLREWHIGLSLESVVSHYGTTKVGKYVLVEETQMKMIPAKVVPA